MNVLFLVDQAAALRRGVDAPNSTVKLDFKPTDFSKLEREIIAQAIEFGGGGKATVPFPLKLNGVFYPNENNIWEGTADKSSTAYEILSKKYAHSLVLVEPTIAGLKKASADKVAHCEKVEAFVERQRKHMQDREKKIIKALDDFFFKYPEQAVVEFDGHRCRQLVDLPLLDYVKSMARNIGITIYPGTKEEESLEYTPRDVIKLLSPRTRKKIDEVANRVFAQFQKAEAEFEQESARVDAAKKKIALANEHLARLWAVEALDDDDLIEFLEQRLFGDARCAFPKNSEELDEAKLAVAKLQVPERIAAHIGALRKMLPLSFDVKVGLYNFGKKDGVSWVAFVNGQDEDRLFDFSWWFDLETVTTHVNQYLPQTNPNYIGPQI
jgi:hypothetical protein